MFKRKNEFDYEEETNYIKKNLMLYQFVFWAVVILLFIITIAAVGSK